MRAITLTNGNQTIVDDDLYESLARNTWYAHKVGQLVYARSIIDEKRVYMHRLVANTPRELVTDHISGDTLDNRRSNLRTATRAQNGRNRPASKGRSFKGVFPQVGGFMARIVIDRRPVYLGYFKRQDEAARAYDAAAVREFGEFAKLNFPEATRLA